MSLTSHPRLSHLPTLTGCQYPTTFTIAISFSAPPLATPRTNPVFSNAKHSHRFLANIISLSLALSLNAPLPAVAIPFAPRLLPPSASTTTPFSQAKNLQFGLENGKIRACPGINPGCISTNAKSSSFSFPWQIPSNSTETAVERLQEAIMTTQKNAKILKIEDTPNGRFLQAEVDGGGFSSRDVLEFLVKGDVVSYRCMAEKVTYVYPFTTAFGDSKGQEDVLKKIVNELGWYAPSFDSMD